MTHRLSFSVLAGALCLTGTLLLSGCVTGTDAFPNVQADPQQVPMGAIQGSDYGGHAPLVGAHVFVLQVGTGGYGSKVTSLIPSAGLTTRDFYGNTFTTTQDTTTGSPTNGMDYITTSNIGTYALSGDYTCTAGYPVYLYASGGNPQTIAPINITGASAQPDINGNLLVTFTNSGTNLLYQGESINFSQFSPATTAYEGEALTTQVVSPLNLTTSSFAVEFGPSSSSVGTQAFTGTVTQNTPVVSNPAVVNLALLGNCPGTVFTGIPTSAGAFTLTGVSAAVMANLSVGENVLGPGINNATISALSPSTGTITFTQADTGGNASTSYTYTATSASAPQNFSSLPFVYMNEVSTVAAAYALAPFATTVTTNDALHIGTSSTNLIGLENAVTTAANLYDIGGSVTGTGGDGETHIARATTPNGGVGTVPQTLLNTLGNILASCVDSANTYNSVTATSGTQSTQCASLLNNATVDGTTGGTKPADTATAAINIAHYPLGAASATNFVSNIFNTITGNSPFQPTLTSAPHDYAVAVTYSTPSGGIAGTSVDGLGNIWTVGVGSNKVYELAPNAVFTTYAPPGGSTVTNAFISSAEIDATSSNVYVPAGAGMLKFQPGISTTGTLITSSNTANASGLTLDNSGNLFIANTVPTAEASSYIQKETIAGVAAGSPFPIIDSSSGVSCTYEVQYVLTDAAGNLWSDNQGNAAPSNAICRYSNAGVLQYEWDFSGSAFPLSYGMALDNGGNLWFSDKDNSVVFKIANGTNYTGGPSQPCSATVGCTQTTGGTVNTPFSAAVDGNNTVWISNSSNGSLVQFANSGTAITPSYLDGISGYLSNVLTLRVDQSGSVWGNSFTANSLVQYVGVAAPTTMPLSYARVNSKLGAKP